jgi:hypothetical protein
MATTDLTRTPSSGGNRKTWTFSVWLKRASKSDSNNSRIFSAGSASTDYTSWFMYAVDGTDATLQFQNRISSSTTNLQTNRKFRDVNGWYHLVIACDTTQATASNRVKIYINGVQETSFATENYPAQDADTFVNHTVAHNIGSSDDAGYTPRYWAGSMSHVALVDGQQLTPTSFGETDSTSGIWKFKSPSGLSWGTNGFHLKFENSGNMGLDSSGQTNNYTVTGGTLSQILDTPSNVYCTMNPLMVNPSATNTFANGNNTVTINPVDATVGATLGVNSGKFYWEQKWTQQGANDRWGVVPGDAVLTNHPRTTGIGWDTASSQFYLLGSAVSGSWGGSIGTSDIIQIALDLDNSALYLGVNGTYRNSGSPTSGSSRTGAVDFSSSSLVGKFLLPACGKGNQDTTTMQYNFGNGFFGTTAVASAGSNGNGSIFEYDVPSGYYALNTKNINTYG